MERNKAIQTLSLKFPWGGKKQKLQKLKGRELLYLAILTPKHLNWCFVTSNTDSWIWLRKEISNVYSILDNIPANIIKCSHCTNNATFLSLYNCQYTGRYFCCDNRSCKEHLHAISGDKNNLVSLKYTSLLKTIRDALGEKYCIDLYKEMYDLPKRYNCTKYLETILANTTIID